MEYTPLNTAFYTEALIVLGAAALVFPLFHRLRISSSDTVKLPSGGERCYA